MTENKRFKMVIADDDGNFYYLDKVTGEKIRSTMQLEDKLNELNDENERLKGSIEELYFTQIYKPTGKMTDELYSKVMSVILTEDEVND